MKARQPSITEYCSQEYSVDGRYEIAIASRFPINGMDLSFVSMTWTDLHSQAVNRILTLQDEVEERNRHINRLDKEIERLRFKVRKPQAFRLDS